MRRTFAEGMALARANARYWPAVAPAVRRELRGWERRAEEIPDPDLKALARAKLREEGFNAEVAATLATRATRARRGDVIRAIVALEVMYDYLDALTERPTPDPLVAGRDLFQAFLDALALDAEPRLTPDAYLAALRDTVRGSLAGLPALAQVAPVARASAARCAEAQLRLHAAPILGSDGLERWARQAAAAAGEAPAPGAGQAGAALAWREWLAGAAASVLAVHALIVAAADARTTAAQARAIDAAYLSICALSTLADSLADHDRDARAGAPGFNRLYGADGELTGALSDLARRGLAQARALPDGAHHAMTLVGVVAYYTSSPGARREPGRTVVAELRRQLGGLYAPTLAIVRAWRMAKRARRRTAINGNTVVYDDLLSNRADIAARLGVGEEAV
jgi:tetraprenyl-beta-curcumene synthase